MIYLLLAIFSSAMLSIVMRLGKDRISSNIMMLAANYLTCLIAAGCYIGFGNIFPDLEGIKFTLALGGLSGILYMLSLLLMQLAVKKSGIVFPVIFSKLGLLISLLISVLIFGERLTIPQLLGTFLAVVAIILINYKKSEQGTSSFNPLLLLLLLAEGVASSMSKIFNEMGNNLLSSHFLFYTFFFAFVLCCIVAAYKKEHFGATELFYGSLIGLFNFFTTRFGLKALETVPAVIVFPTRGVGTILVVSLAGILLFSEKLSKKQWIAVGIIMAALVLLNI